MHSNNKTDVINRELDARGLFCPEPVMMLHNAIREMTIGERIRVLATDPSTQRDIPKFCQFLGHALLQNDTIKNDSVDVVYAYTISKNK